MSVFFRIKAHCDVEPDKYVCRCGLGKSGSAGLTIFTQEKTFMTMDYVL